MTNKSDASQGNVKEFMAFKINLSEIKNTLNSNNHKLWYRLLSISKSGV